MAYWKEEPVRKKPTHQEDAEQEAFIQWCWFQSEKYKGLDLIYAIPNGGKRDKVEAVKLKRTGVKAGVPDLFLPVARGGYHGLYIEMKRRDGGRLSAYQQQWLMALSAQGYATAVCHGLDEAIKAVENYYAV